MDCSGGNGCLTRGDGDLVQATNDITDSVEAWDGCFLKAVDDNCPRLIERCPQGGDQRGLWCRTEG